MEPNDSFIGRERKRLMSGGKQRLRNEYPIAHPPITKQIIKVRKNNTVVRTEMWAWEPLCRRRKGRRWRKNHPKEEKNRGIGLHKKHPLAKELGT